MSDKIIWGDTALATDIVEPSTEKQHQGWELNELPPHEYFNWYFNRTDSRLNDLEDKTPQYTSMYSGGNTRTGDIEAGTSYTVPQYTVGTGQLRIYLDGLICIRDVTYEEVGEDGSVSTSIKWLDKIGKEYAIMADVH